MPGILPMKMIRVGTSSQSRIAQACDRCRSKKIRCDGVRPCCSQCANVGFECKTSDKLSRRAFPRGYTESLEDRVRSLETEVRELKQLLDEKDEKLDMLSRIHSFSPASRKVSQSHSLSPPSSTHVKAEAASTQEEVLYVEIPAPVQPSTSSMGTSTTSALIEAFESKVQEQGRSCSAITPSELLSPVPAVKAPSSSNSTCIVPPRLLSDQYINLFFQEWQPLLPILHRQTFLRLYEQFLAEPDARSLQGNKLAIAQLFLIFEVAAHSSSSKARPNTAAYEIQWRKALSAAPSTPSIATLQCHILAQLCYLLKADYPHLLRHRAYAVSICHQLGLHQGHKLYSLPTFEVETRKKVFWCQYVLDKFASATTGVPMLMRDADITADYPADVDDENIDEQRGFSPALPGELTKISSALALFRMSRILAKILEHLYPASASYSISLKKLHSLSDELDQWHEELPDHLRLRFCNDKPATHLISDRSPLLSLAYFHTRSLIHRPLLCHGSGSATASATIVIAAAAKHIIQIIDLLDERCMNYTFPVNKQDILLNAGFSILWQCMDLEDDSKIVKDNQKSLTLLSSKISKENAAANTEFHKVAASFVTIGGSRPQQPKHINIDTPAAKLLSSMPAPQHHKQKTARKQLQAIAARFSGFNSKDKPEEQHRRKTFEAQADLASLATSYPRTSSTVSLVSTQSAPALPLSTPSPRTSIGARFLGGPASTVNLDYFPLDNNVLPVTSHNSSTTMLPPKHQSPSISNNNSWEHLVPEHDVVHIDPFHNMDSDVLNKCVSNPETLDWTGDMWPYSMNMNPKVNIPQSLLSFSEESLTSGEDFGFSIAGSHHGSMSTHESVEMPNEETFKGIAMPVSSIEDDVDFIADVKGS